MKTIKKYWMLFVAGIAAIFGIFMLTSKRRSNKKLDKLQKQIDDNKEIVDQLDGKIEIVEEQREEVKEEIKQQEQVITDLKEQKDNIVIEEPNTVQEAKQNILNKTKRGRKPKRK